MLNTPRYIWLHSIIFMWLVMATTISAETKPTLWGYGVKPCGDYIQMWLGVEKGLPEDIAAYRRYQDWLSGFVSGLNTAVNTDVLTGVTIDGAMRRIYLYCEDHHKKDVYTATRDLVRQLNEVEVTP